MSDANTPTSVLARAQASLNQGDSAQAVQALSAALRESPDQASLWAALGLALREEARPDLAAAAFIKVLHLEPGQVDAQMHLGMIRLAQGRQTEGWLLCQARWDSPRWAEPMRYPQQSLWKGECRPGMRLLLWAEQGLGDALQFGRYAPWLQQLLQSQGASVVLEVPEALLRLLQESWPALDIVARGRLPGHFDAHLPLTDLPYCWRGLGEGRLPYLPLDSPYLRAPSAPVVPSTSLQRQSPVLKVGLVWQGRPAFPGDRWHSLPFAALQPLWDVPGVTCVSLQQAAADAPAWLPDAVQACEDCADLARVVQGLDLVLGVDSDVAHLAAALGKPVWLLLPRAPDWRWGLQGEGTPWYPAMRLFRRGGQEACSEVIHRAAAALGCLVSERLLLGLVVA